MTANTLPADGHWLRHRPHARGVCLTGVIAAAIVGCGQGKRTAADSILAVSQKASSRPPAVAVSPHEVSVSPPDQLGSSPFIEDLTWQEVQNAISAGKTTAIIYIGSTEQNGPHMVIGKHNFLAHYIAGEISRKLGNALVYPTLPFAPTGDPIRKTGHMRFPGSVSLRPESLHGVVRDVAVSAISAGFRNIALMGDHGDGQDILASTSKELDAEWKPKGVRVIYVPDVYFKAKAQAHAYEAAHGITNDKHAGTDDTSELMAIDGRHQWIRTDKLALNGGSGTATSGVDGDPSKATPAIGRIFIGYKVDDAVAQIRKATGTGR